MNIVAARDAIEAILAAIPDNELPDFDCIDTSHDGKTVVWWGGTGHTLGCATRNGEREPLVHRSSGSWSAIEAEMVYRADRRFLDNGDKPVGATKQVSS